ncbi:hypothetical protein SAMN05661093_05970 [Kibdelosporangium aridum]|uniref:Uncharacterized protein n=1 Tax=Kibdelosporangium aridum TaxID=2030 RepID=A0A1W2FAL9_KIBAR|nr:hypothetical protein SAMN05661093_05970 [Kibdelosporangium aridum]
MGLDRPHGDVQRCGDLPVGQPLRDEPGDLTFARGQNSWPGKGFRGGHQPPHAHLFGHGPRGLGQCGRFGGVAGAVAAGKHAGQVERGGGDTRRQPDAIVDLDGAPQVPYGVVKPVAYSSREA